MRTIRVMKDGDESVEERNASLSRLTIWKDSLHDETKINAVK